jgi:hypothetical protein
MKTLTEFFDLPGITEEQAVALFHYADLKGKAWKSDLLSDWQSGRDVTALDHLQIDGCYLRQVRNTKGPKWLAKI